MGRYYSGDIEGKFWFGVQSSDAASRFGGTETAPSTIEYFFSDEDLEGVEEELANIKERLGEQFKVLEDFFVTNNGYRTCDMTALGITDEQLSDYADYGLGIKIRDSIIEKGQCWMECEL